MTDDETGEPLIQRSDDNVETLRRRLTTYHQVSRRPSLPSSHLPDNATFSSCHSKPALSRTFTRSLASGRPSMPRRAPSSSGRASPGASTPSPRTRSTSICWLHENFYWNDFSSRFLSLSETCVAVGERTDGQARAALFDELFYCRCAGNSLTYMRG